MAAPAPTLDLSALDLALDRGIDFLRNRQLSNGEFATLVSNSVTMDSPAPPDSTITATVVVLYSIDYIDRPITREIIAKGREFLAGEMKEPGVWSYWTTRAQRVIDPDVDDTCLASFALGDHHSAVSSARNLELIRSNRNEKGLFYTWFRPPAARNDIDSVVNANALLYLGERPETRAAIAYLNHIVLTHQVKGSSHYYPDEMSFYYALSRAYYHGVRQLHRAKEGVISGVLQRRQPGGDFGNALATAQACCCLFNYQEYEHPQLNTAIRSLLQAQREDGSWPRIAFWTGPEPPAPHVLFWGAEEITTALSLETLGRYRSFLDPSTINVEHLVAVNS